MSMTVYTVILPDGERTVRFDTGRVEELSKEGCRVTAETGTLSRPQD
jgi:hypothetical protein